ncbi:MAG TPA: spore germination protein [Bacillus sp. (in: firmicutes)]|nr:spore germination protein [Bacillus sp. (in: firmicutes)]
MIFFRRPIKKLKKPFAASFQTSLHSANVPQLYDKIAEIKKLFNEESDLVVKHFIHKQTQSSAALVFLNSLNDQEAIHAHILTPLLFGFNQANKNQDSAVSINQIEITESWSKIKSAISEGNSVLFTGEMKEVFIFSAQNFPQRTIENSHVGASLRSAYQGFTEIN